MPLIISGVSGKARKSGIAAGDTLLSINKEAMLDLIDYISVCEDDHADIVFKKPNGTLKTARIKKEAGEDIGIEFEDGFGKTRGCANNCMFCFVDQLPKGMRESLYFKDDDWRMSLIMGNYVTLTNVAEKEFQRILDREVSPLYISVHATDDDVRERMIGQKRARGIMDRLRRFAEAGMSFHAQAVVVPGVNDGEVLEKTIRDLASLAPCALSLAVVPVGLTCHREGLEKISPMTKEEAAAIIAVVERLQKELLPELETRFVFAADELYIKAGLPFPEAETYEGFLQIGDGVGMAANFRESFELGFKSEEKCDLNKTVSLACGVDIAPFMQEIADQILEKFGVRIHVYGIENRFFGETITVTGLLTGQDIAAGLKGKELGEQLLLSESMLRDNTNVFLDDMTKEELEEALGVGIQTVQGDGYDFLMAVLGITEEENG